MTSILGLVIGLQYIPEAVSRTALSGTAVTLDMLVVCPGIHTQQEAVSLNGGEYPACTALTTAGYVFRVENPATVYYLQRVGRTGQLTTLSVSSIDSKDHGMPRLRPCFSPTTIQP